MKITNIVVEYIRAAGYKFAVAFSGLTLLMVLAQPATARAAASMHAANDVTGQLMVGALQIKNDR